MSFAQDTPRTRDPVSARRGAPRVDIRRFAVATPIGAGYGTRVSPGWSHGRHQHHQLPPDPDNAVITEFRAEVYTHMTNNPDFPADIIEEAKRAELIETTQMDLYESIDVAKKALRSSGVSARKHGETLNSAVMGYADSVVATVKYRKPFETYADHWVSRLIFEVEEIDRQAHSRNRARKNNPAHVYR
jgi:hypothetical protein